MFNNNAENNTWREDKIKHDRTTKCKCHKGFRGLRRSEVRFNFSCNLIGNHPQSLTALTLDRCVPQRCPHETTGCPRLTVLQTEIKRQEPTRRIDQIETGKANPTRTDKRGQAMIFKQTTSQQQRLCATLTEEKNL